MTKIVRWFIKKFLPGYHLAKDPVKGTGRKKRNSKILEEGQKTELDDLQDEAIALMRQKAAVEAGGDFGRLLRKGIQAARERAEKGEGEV